MTKTIEQHRGLLESHKRWFFFFLGGTAVAGAAFLVSTVHDTNTASLSPTQSEAQAYNKGVGAEQAAYTDNLEEYFGIATGILALGSAYNFIEASRHSYIVFRAEENKTFEPPEQTPATN